MRLRKFRRRFGIAAPQLVVRNQIPWQWVLATSVLWLCLLIFFHWLDSAADHADSHELRKEILQLRTEVEALSIVNNTAGNVANMEKATQQQLALRIQALERENTALKEDIRVFERLIPQGKEDGQVRIDSALIVKVADGYQYRAVFRYRPSKKNPLFQGRLQLFVTLADGRTLIIPESGEPEAFSLEFKNFTRREGPLPLPDNTPPTTVEFRVMEGDTLRSKYIEQIKGSKHVRTQN